MILSAPIPWSAAAFAAGLATGIRSQVAWLTLPLLTLRVLDDRSGASRFSKRLLS